MAQDNGILGLSLVEKDNNGDVLVSWSFPYVEQECKQVALYCANLVNSNNSAGNNSNSSGGNSGNDQEVVVPLQFLWTRFKTFWIHVYTSSNDLENKENPLPKVVSVSFVLVSSVIPLSPISTYYNSFHHQHTINPLKLLFLYYNNH